MKPSLLLAPGVFPAALPAHRVMSDVKAGIADTGISSREVMPTGYLSCAGTCGSDRAAVSTATGAPSCLP